MAGPAEVALPELIEVAPSAPFPAEAVSNTTLPASLCNSSIARCPDITPIVTWITFTVQDPEVKTSALKIAVSQESPLVCS